MQPAGPIGRPSEGNGTAAPTTDTAVTVRVRSRTWLKSNSIPTWNSRKSRPILPSKGSDVWASGGNRTANPPGQSAPSAEGPKSRRDLADDGGLSPSLRQPAHEPSSADNDHPRPQDCSQVPFDRDRVHDQFIPMRIIIV